MHWENYISISFRTENCTPCCTFSMISDYSVNTSLDIYDTKLMENIMSSEL